MNSLRSEDTKINAFLYTNNKVPERKIKNTIPFTIVPKIIKYLEINLTTEVKDLYSENYRTLIKDTEDTHKYKDMMSTELEGGNRVLLK